MLDCPNLKVSDIRRHCKICMGFVWLCFRLIYLTNEKQDCINNRCPSSAGSQRGFTKRYPRRAQWNRITCASDEEFIKSLEHYLKACGEFKNVVSLIFADKLNSVPYKSSCLTWSQIKSWCIFHIYFARGWASIVVDLFDAKCSKPRTHFSSHCWKHRMLAESQKW